MATFDQLSAEQRAIVELVLQQGKTYAELADMLGMPESRVRELARGALVELAPVSVRGVEEDWRGQLADYVLGQQSGPEATATKGHLRRSEAARSWTRSLLDSLEQLYSSGSLPAIPDGERGRSRERPAGAGLGEDPVMRRRVLAGAAALALLVVLVWPVGLLTGDDDSGGEASENGGAQTAGQGQNAAGGGIDAQTRGQALIAQQGGREQILVSATGLEPTTEGTAYQVWLYNDDDDRRSLGAQVTDQQGNFQASQRLPGNYRDFEFIDVTSVRIQGENLQPGDSVLRGLLELRDEPITRGQGQNRVSLLGEIDLRPLPAAGG